MNRYSSISVYFWESTGLGAVPDRPVACLCSASFRSRLLIPAAGASSIALNPNLEEGVLRAPPASKNGRCAVRRQGYSSSPIAVNRNHKSQVAFSLRKGHFARYCKESMHWRTALSLPTRLRPLDCGIGSDLLRGSRGRGPQEAVFAFWGDKDGSSSVGWLPAPGDGVPRKRSLLPGVVGRVLSLGW